VGAVALAGGTSQELSEIVERAGVPFAVLLVLIWAIKWGMENFAKPLAQKHIEFVDKTTASQERLTTAFEGLREDGAATRADLRELVNETKKQTSRFNGAETPK
jgi:hypothetical protein